MADSVLLDWANKQPDWVKDALRRHAESSSNGLTADAKAAIVDRVEHSVGKAFDAPPVCDPITGVHLAGVAAPSKNRTTLCSIGPVKNLNRLAEKQQLIFALGGITLIYGDNGSGKSGYARIAKQICRSLTKDDLLGDVFSLIPQPPAEVQIRFIPEGASEPVTVDWKFGAPPPIELADISVFDSANATFYANKDNKIGFLPAEIALLQQHAAHRDYMRDAFDAQAKTIANTNKAPLNLGYSATGKVAPLLGALDIKSETLPTVAEIEALSTWTPENEAELTALTKELLADPAQLAGQRRRMVTPLKALAMEAAQIETSLSTEAAASYKALLQAEKVTAEAAKLAADSSFSALPMKGIGQNPWQLMYEYARRYAESTGLPAGKLPDAVGDLCVTCLTPLSEEAAARMKSFNDFVSNQAKKDADAAAAARQTALKKLQDLVIAAKAQVAISLAEYAALGDIEKAVADKIAKYFEAAMTRRATLVNATTAEGVDTAVPLMETPQPQVAQILALLEKEAAEYDEAAKKDTARVAQQKRHAELSDQKKLSENKAVVLERLAQLQRYKHFKNCAAAVGTTEISKQITQMRRSSVMKGLGKRILEELKNLGLSHIPFEVNDSSQTGQSYFGVNLTGAGKVDKSKILSEGEQRALALACFLGEVGGDNARNGLIIDDPVSSLDHIRLRHVANRLVDEAQSRQVIIFTHNILFFNEVRDTAARSIPPVPITANYISKNSADGFGLISQSNEPWQMAKVATRIHRLRERLGPYDSVTDFDTEDWRVKAKDFYTDLRETWERLVEELVLGKVVERYSSEVQTLRLKEVVMSDDDYKTVYWAMRRASERSGHDLAPGKSIPLSTLKEMKTDLDAIETFSVNLRKRVKETTEARKKLEQPPVAATA